MSMRAARNAADAHGILDTVDVRTLLQVARNSPGMYFAAYERRFDLFVAYVQGLDDGSDGRLLDGFREFLVLRYEGATNKTWWTLIVAATLPEGHWQPSTQQQHDATIDAMFDVLDAFLSADAPGFRASIHSRYEVLMKRPDDD